MSGSAATTNPSVTAAWADDTGSAFTEGASDSALNGATPVTIVAAPASSTRRIVKNITIANIDTAPVTFTLSYNDNSTLRTVVKVTLAVNDTWTTEGTFDSAGNLKTSFASFSGLLLPANGGTGIANNNSSTIAISGSFPLTATLTGSTGVTFPTSGTLYGTASGSITSAQLATSLTDETGSGANVFANTPTLVTPILGTPTSGSLANCTGYALANLTGAGSGVLTFLATPSSANLASALTDETGTGVVVFNNKPTFLGTIQTITAIGALALDGSLGNMFTKTIGTGSTFTQSNFSVGQNFVVTVSGAFTITWFGGITWFTTGASAPTQGALTSYGFTCTATNTFNGYLVGTQ